MIADTDADVDATADDAEDDVALLDAQDLNIGFKDLVRMNEAGVTHEEVVKSKSWKMPE